MKAKPKSNTWVVLTPIVLWFGLAFAYTQWWQPPEDSHFDYLLATGLGIPFIASGVAQLRSRYLWQNLRPGNRGTHQSENPKKFIFSTVFYFIIGFGIVIAFVVLSAKEGANKTSILTPDPWRVEIIMTIQTSIQQSERTLGQA